VIWEDLAQMVESTVEALASLSSVDLNIVLLSFRTFWQSFLRYPEYFEQILPISFESNFGMAQPSLDFVVAMTLQFPLNHPLMFGCQSMMRLSHWDQPLAALLKLVLTTSGDDESVWGIS